MLLEKYLLSMPRGEAARLAKEVRDSPSNLSSWRSGSKPVPINKCVLIEKATKGKVTRKDLRPNDWQEIWPELQ